MWARFEAGELVLPGARRHRQIVDQPVVERAVVGEFERAERMRHPLDRVGLAVREIVGGVDAPGVAGARVARLEDPVEHRVAQVDVAGRHVDPGTQHAGALVELARPHPPQEIEVFLGRSVAKGAFPAGLGEGPPHRADVLGARIVDIGPAFAHQMLGPLVKPFEMIRREMQVLGPVIAEPADVGLDGVDELRLLLRRVGVVEAEMAAPAELPGDAEIEHDRLGVADMEIAVGLGREAGDHLRGSPGGDVVPHDAPDEIAGRLVLRLGDGHPAFRSHSPHFSPTDAPSPSCPDLFRASTPCGIALRAGNGRGGGGTWMPGTSPGMTAGARGWPENARPARHCPRPSAHGPP